MTARARKKATKKLEDARRYLGQRLSATTVCQRRKAKAVSE